MIKFKKVRVYQEQIDNAHTRIVSLFINDRTSRSYKILRAKVNVNAVSLIQQTLTFFNYNLAKQFLFDSRGDYFDSFRVEASGIKKTVRIDNELYKALYNEAHFNSDNGEMSFNKLVNTDVSKRIELGEFALLPTRKFSHRITIRFSLEDYIRIQKVVYELRENKELEWVNFSVVVRSILYEALGLITEYRISHRSPKQLLSVA